jgi:hypothetical protein
MVATSLTLVSPWALALCLLAAAPGAIAIAVERRQARVCATLGLAPPRPRRTRWAGGSAAVACIALGVAAAQPVLAGEVTRRSRTASEIVFVVDVSRSMLASPAAGAPTRLDRAREAVRSLRVSVPDVPAGVSGLTDRVLPYLFPSLDLAAFAATVDRSVLPESPPPDRAATVATSFAGLGALASDGFFSRGARTRTCVLVTDGETRTDDGAADTGSPVTIFGGSGGADDPAAGAAALAGPRGCSLMVLAVGGSNDRIRHDDGRVEAAFRPEPTAAATLRRLADDAGGRLFSAGSTAAAARALRAATDAGPTRNVGVRATSRPLAGLFAALGAIAALAALAASTGVRAVGRPSRVYDLLHRRSYG